MKRAKFEISNERFEDGGHHHQLTYIYVKGVAGIDSLDKWMIKHYPDDWDIEIENLEYDIERGEYDLVRAEEVGE